MTQCVTLSVESNMVKEFAFRSLSHWWHVYGSQIKRKTNRQNLTLMTLNVELCQLDPIWLMTAFRALSHWWHVYGSHIFKQTDRS